VVTDRLGSVRYSSGVSRSYFPYGEERTVTSDDTEKFGTYFSDAAGQDYAEQRYYNNGTGRFWSVDPGGIGSADPSTPTSLNRYAYTNGDPVNFFDRHGLIVQAPSAEDCIANPDSAAGQAIRKIACSLRFAVRREEKTGQSEADRFSRSRRERFSSKGGRGISRPPVASDQTRSETQSSRFVRSIGVRDLVDCPRICRHRICPAP